ncbi:bestrophin-2, partial [Hyalella azteca]|uniref:Bestrophin homolog n=1 Tax=Hyalella azteca TaxID=294128 RepID=A0A979FT23_HYAAZ
NEKARVIRRTVLRYVNLTFAITMSMISPPIKKRFPTMDHLVEMGLLTEQEHMIFQILNAKTSYSKYWMPLIWAGALVSKARKEGRIRDDFAVKTIMDELNNFRRGCGRLLSYDSISVPLVYTQVVTLSVYTFFVATIVGRQFLDPSQNYDGNTVDLYIPWFTILQFFFYMGWLKVAESLINPFGEDDDDFEINALIDRNIVVSYLIVDEMHEDHPELIKDMYFEEVVPAALPYTVATEHYRTLPSQGSTANLQIPEHQQEILDPIQEEGEEGEVETVTGGITTVGSTPIKTVPSDLKTVASTPMKYVASDVEKIGSVPPTPRRRRSFIGGLVSRISSAASRKVSGARAKSSTSVGERRRLRATSAAASRAALAQENLINTVSETDENGKTS